MKLAIAIVLALVVVASAESAYPDWAYEAFDHWCAEWDKTYDSPSEKEFRVGVFYANMKNIEETNAAQDSYRLGPNGFTDLTTEEFLQLHTGLLPMNIEESDEEIVEVTGYADSVDWVTKGAVTGVKNQGECGACWSFSATGALEGIEFIIKGHLISLSEQELIDCSQKFNNYGCKGGSPDNAFSYVEQLGITTEAYYPYTAKQGSCKYSSASVVVKSSKHRDLLKRSESAFLSALDTQPISISIDADQIMSYTSGIYNNANCGTTVNHAALAVGYDTSAGYIKVKNSWGTTWGESGYIRFALLGNGSGECGIYLQSSLPII